MRVTRLGDPAVTRVSAKMATYGKDGVLTQKKWAHAELSAIDPFINPFHNFNSVNFMLNNILQLFIFLEFFFPKISIADY